MTLHGVSKRESAFTTQSESFLEAAHTRFPAAPTSIDEALSEQPRPVSPFVVDGLDITTREDLNAVAGALTAGTGIAYVVPRSFSLPRPGEQHPLLHLARKLGQHGVIGFAIDHPMEGHLEAVARFGPPDGTLKLYDLPIPEGRDKYREQAETHEMFAAHNDGLGYAGLIQHVIMTLDRPPLAGGFTYFRNLVSLAPALAHSDPEAFEALFLPDAITALRPRGKGAIKVISPVFFMGRNGAPQVFLRVNSGEYRIQWRKHEALSRARRILERCVAPFGPGSRFVHFMRPGDTVIVDNTQVVHGRTSFVDPDGAGRTLARKWFVAAPDDASYRHVPGIAVHREWAELFPDLFGKKVTEGEWHYDARAGTNIRLQPPE